jgi:hypothetical protein
LLLWCGDYDDAPVSSVRSNGRDDGACFWCRVLGLLEEAAMTAKIYRIDSGAIADERKAQAIVRNATAAYRSSLQDALLLTMTRGGTLREVLTMLDDLVPTDADWDSAISDLKDSYR